MMRPNARALIEQLTEATAKGMAIFFGPKWDQRGILFVDKGEKSVFVQLADQLAQHTMRDTSKVIRQNPEDFINALLTKGMVAILYEDGEISVYSESPRVSLNNMQLSRLERLFGIKPETPVIWFHDMVSGEYRTGTADSVFYGKHPSRNQPSIQTNLPQSPRHKAKKWINTGELTGQQWDYLTGKTEVPPSGI